MSTIVTINSGDLISDSRSDLNTNFENLNTDKEEVSNKSTDTTLSANSDTLYPSQKAVKTYIDTVGGANASTLVRGVVEEATQAEVDAGTATGGTGARLFINPSLNLGAAKNLTAGETITGATLPVPVYQNKTDNEFYMCDANDATRYKFVGFAISNGVDGGGITIRFSGLVSGFSGLDEGQKYYVSDTIGTISNTPGTQEILVGIAISPTELLIQKGTFRAGGSITYADAGGTSAQQSTVVTLGFRPSVVRTVAASANGTGFFGFSQGVHIVSSNSAYCVGASGGGGSSAAGHGAFFNYDWNWTINTITDTGFTITVTQIDSTPDDLAMAWEAEGEL